MATHSMKTMNDHLFFLFADQSRIERKNNNNNKNGTNVHCGKSD